MLLYFLNYQNIFNQKDKKIDLIQNKALELSLFLSLPASIALLIGSKEIISALFGYGQFNESSVSNTSDALYYFSLGLPAFAMIKVFSNFFFANHDTKTPFYISLLSVFLNILISVYFFRSIGFIIIPIATPLFLHGLIQLFYFYFYEKEIYLVLMIFL